MDAYCAVCEHAWDPFFDPSSPLSNNGGRSTTTNLTKSCSAVNLMLGQGSRVPPGFHLVDLNRTEVLSNGKEVKQYELVKNNQKDGGGGGGGGANIHDGLSTTVVEKGEVKGQPLMGRRNGGRSASYSSKKQGDDNEDDDNVKEVASGREKAVVDDSYKYEVAPGAAADSYEEHLLREKAITDYAMSHIWEVEMEISEVDGFEIQSFTEKW
jgi:hypothetical protein